MTQPTLSFEFFPPRSEAQQRRFWHTLGCLQTLEPAYISMTWGALGSASQASLDVLTHLLKDASVPVTAHLSCSGQSEAQMQGMIRKLEELGITRFLALRGDGSPSDAQSLAEREATLPHAADLVRLLAQDSTRDISVAAYPEVHPEAPSVEADLFRLKEKLDAGAKRAITQFFFDADTFLKFRDRAVAAGIRQDLIPGILPIHDIQKVADFSSRCGATVPEKLFTRFGKANDDSSRKEVAIEQCVELCQHLRREGVNEFHVYTLNQSVLPYAVSRELMDKPVKTTAAA